MERAKKTAQELGLVVGPEGAAMAREYKRAMNEVQHAHTAIQVQIGNELMPVFSQMAKMMAHEAPLAAKGFAAVLQTLGMAFLALKFIIETVVTTISALVMSVVDGIGALVRAFLKVQQADFSGAVNELKQGASDVKGDWVAAGDNIAESWKKNAAGINELWRPTKLAPPPTTKADGRYDPETDADKTKAAKEQLAIDTALAKEREQIALTGLEMEERILDEEVAANKVAADEELAARVSLEQQKFLVKKATLETMAALEANEPAKRIAIDTQLMQLEQEHQKKLTALRRSGIADVNAAALDELNARRRMADAGIEAERNALSAKRKLEEVSGTQELQELQNLERQKYEVARQFIEAQLALKTLDTKKRKELEAELFQLEQDYHAKRLELQTELTTLYREQADRLLQPFVQGFQDGISRMLEGTLSFKDAVKGIFGMLRMALAQSIAGIVSDWIAALARKLAAWLTMKAIELVTHETTESAKTTATVAGAVTRGTAEAVEGGIAAGASAATIPGIGWLIALPVAGAVIGGLLTYLAMASAAGGYDIPAGVNPVVQTHAKEMILPARYAEIIRGLADGEAKPASEPSPTVNVNVSTMDSRSFERALSDHDSALVKVIHEAVRNGRLNLGRG
jgi:hypothetical protein